MTAGQALVKRGFDIVGATIGLICLGWALIIAWCIARIDTGAPGFFRQERVGRFGRRFEVIKLRTMRVESELTTTVTTSSDPRITRIGRFFRRSKLDELPQLINVLRGEMSFVGPRPDVAGFADLLKGPESLILRVRPGITGPATLNFRNEEELLAECEDPERYNREVIYPEKVRLNLAYIENYRFREDLRIIWKTLVSG